MHKKLLLFAAVSIFFVPYSNHINTCNIIRFSKEELNTVNTEQDQWKKGWIKLMKTKLENRGYTNPAKIMEQNSGKWESEVISQLKPEHSNEYGVNIVSLTSFSNHFKTGEVSLLLQELVSSPQNDKGSL